MKYLIIFILFTITISAQTQPSGYTTNYNFRLWAQGANPTADSLNANWVGIDAVIKGIDNKLLDSLTAQRTRIVAAYDSAQSKVNLWNNQTIGGVKTFGTIVTTGRLRIPVSAPSTPAEGNLYWNNPERALFVDIDGTANYDSIPNRDWIRNYVSGVLGTEKVNYRTIYSEFVADDGDSIHANVSNLKEYIHNYEYQAGSNEGAKIIIRFAFEKFSGDDSVKFSFQGRYLGDGSPSYLDKNVRTYINGNLKSTSDVSNGSGYSEQSVTYYIGDLPNGINIFNIVTEVNMASGAGFIKLRYPTVSIKY